MTTIVTHNGYFHTDDLFAVAVLLMKFSTATVVRTRDEEKIQQADIVVDVGRINNPKKLRFDHHQAEGAGVRENGIPYASIGLVWKEFGAELAGGPLEAAIVEEKLVMPIDAGDNGVDLYTLKNEDIPPYTIGEYFDSYIEDAQTMEEYDAGFSQALPVAQDLLRKEIAHAKRLVADWKEVEAIYDSTDKKEIIVLPLNKSWKKILIPSQAKFVIFPRPDGQWSARAIPSSLHSFALKHKFPQAWAGLDNGELVHTSGVSDATFCHRDLWLANAKSQEGAIKLAEIALNS